MENNLLNKIMDIQIPSDAIGAMQRTGGVPKID